MDTDDFGGFIGSQTTSLALSQSLRTGNMVLDAIITLLICTLIPMLFGMVGKGSHTFITKHLNTLRRRLRHTDAFSINLSVNALEDGTDTAAFHILFALSLLDEFWIKNTHGMSRWVWTSSNQGTMSTRDVDGCTLSKMDAGLFQSEKHVKLRLERGDTSALKKTALDDQCKRVGEVRREVPHLNSIGRAIWIPEFDVPIDVTDAFNRILTTRPLKDENSPRLDLKMRNRVRLTLVHELDQSDNILPVNIDSLLVEEEEEEDKNKKKEKKIRPLFYLKIEAHPSDVHAIHGVVWKAHNIYLNANNCHFARVLDESVLYLAVHRQFFKFQKKASDPHRKLFDMIRNKDGSDEEDVLDEVDGKLLFESTRTSANSRNFDALFFPEKKRIFDHICDFAYNLGPFDDRTSTKKLTILLTGPPGTGKTSLIKAVASFLERTIVLVSLKTVRTNQELREIMSLRYNLHYNDGDEMCELENKNVVFVLEEFDVTANHKVLRDREDGEVETKFDELNLGGVLDAFDGFTDNHDRVIIATSNRIQDLDKAILRPGRIDIHLVMNNLTFECARDMVEYTYSAKITKEQGGRLNQIFSDHPDEISPSFLETVCKVAKRGEGIDGVLSMLERSTKTKDEADQFIIDFN